DALRRERVGRAVDAAAHAAVVPADQDAPALVDRHVVEVELVAARAFAADAAPLDRIAGRQVLGGPGRAAVEGGRDVQVPDAGELGLIVGARGGGAVERERGAVAIAGDHRG